MAAAIFAEKDFAGIVTGRADPAADGCGASTFIRPAELAAFVAPIAKSLRRRAKPSYTPYRSGPTLKPDAPVHKPKGSAFLVYIVVGDTAPPPLLK